MVQQEDEEDCGNRRNRIENIFGVLRGGGSEPSERRARIRDSWRNGPGEEDPSIEAAAVCKAPWL